MRFRGDSRNGEPLMAYSAPSSVRLYSSSPRFSRMASVDFPPEGGPSSNKQPSPHIGARRSRLEVIDHPTQRLIDAEQLAFEQLAGFLDVVALGIAAVPEKHVPDVFVARAVKAAGRVGRTWVKKSPRRSLPALRAVFLAESVQRIQEIRRTGLFF